MTKFTRKPFDLDTYVHDIQTKPCFLCEIVARNPEFDHHLIYEDEIAIAFLNKYPVLYGYTLVAPKEHREQANRGFHGRGVSVASEGCIPGCRGGAD